MNAEDRRSVAIYIRQILLFHHPSGGTPAMQERIAARPDRPQFLTLQWHLTAKCGYRCQHCYVNDPSTYKEELENEMDLDGCFRVVDEFDDTVNDWGVPGRINFTGGDPLLKEGVFDLIERSKSRGITVGILGNPDTLTPETARKLKDLGLYRYQVSIDGMEETHDTLRGKKGAFKEAIDAIHLLNEVGISSVVMFTLSRANAHELLDVIRLADRESVSIFDFARLVPVGRGVHMKDEMLDPLEYHELLLRVLEEYKRLKDSGTRTRYGRKENLWSLLYDELGLGRVSSSDNETIFSGCAMGCSIVTLLADGTVLACRRLPVPIGKVPDQTIREIFISSPEHNRIRRVEDMKKCGRCDLLQYCRGCPAVAYGVHGDYLAEDPQCWKVV